MCRQFESVPPVDFVGLLFKETDYAMPTDLISAPEEMDASDTEVNFRRTDLPAVTSAFQRNPLSVLNSMLCWMKQIR